MDLVETFRDLDLLYQVMIVFAVVAAIGGAVSELYVITAVWLLLGVGLFVAVGYLGVDE